MCSYELSTSALGFTMECAKSGGGASASEPPARLLPGALRLVSREESLPPSSGILPAKPMFNTTPL